MAICKEDKAASTAATVEEPGDGQPPDEARQRRAKVTPLPMNQLVPMTFVLLNESISGTMLLPFVGLLVAHLRGIPVNEAGYYSGILIGVFMLGQVVSAKTWGYLSDKYGRRFPIISGLFTSGLMMLGFGLSTNVWMCASFRFLHGLFNGNVMVAKTMMADITDKTNAAKGFAFVSLSYGIGVLIGPTLGGVLYDPANSSALQWAHISTDSIFSRKPALLPSLVIFLYTNIGMVVCTFFVMESNPNAQPLPSFVRFIYPCLWREPRMFVHPSATAKDVVDTPAASTNSDVEDDGGNDGVSIESAERLVRNVGLSCTVVSLTVASPVLHEDPRFNGLVGSETLSGATERATGVTPRYGRSHSSLAPAHSTIDADREGPSSLQSRCGSGGAAACGASTLDAAHKESRKTRDTSDEDGHVIVVSTNDAGELEQPSTHGDEEPKSFGYREAFTQPITRTMLVLYMVLSAADMAVSEIVPLWAIAHVDRGGLGFGADKVGYIIFTNSVPCVASNLLFHWACTRFANKLTLFRLAVMECCIAIALLPFTYYLKVDGHIGLLLFPAVILCTSVRQFFSSWCYGLVTMLTAHSAPPAHVGSIMGINQSCGALVRAFVPLVVTPLFAWSITSGNSFPLNHVFVFFLSSLTFLASSLYSMSLRTNEAGVLEIVERNWACVGAARDTVLRWYHSLRGTASR
ncbi:transporter [Novymonas esmeraldas]|uniref:Transporter n=1 Tax=Novymonas esmeraldas TaxID=1808958 RepID=A0AAW0F5L8_9TRYP